MTFRVPPSMVAGIADHRESFLISGHERKKNAYGTDDDEYVIVGVFPQLGWVPVTC